MMYHFFLNELADLEEIYKSKFTDRELSVMWSALSHLTEEQLHLAIDLAIREWGRNVYQFSTNALLEFIEGKQEALLNQEAREEWATILDQMNQPFDYPISLKKRTSLALKRIGGISLIRECPISQLSYKRTEFIHQYKEIGEVHKAIASHNSSGSPVTKQLEATVSEAFSDELSASISNGRNSY